MKRFPVLYVLPTLGLLLLLVGPLVSGRDTLFYRDVMNTHLPKKVVQAEAMSEGRLPMIDPRRDGGQPFLGNPNAAPFYPDNALYLLASPIWALNAHFWLHLLLAPFAFFWLGRAWGLGREAAWAGGVLYAGSGYFLSILNLYNMVPGTALAPALVASVLGLGKGSRPGAKVALTAVLWAVLIVGGDPMSAVMAFFLAALALVFGHGIRRIPWLPAMVAFTLGTILAAPQWVEFLRVLPLSFRGHAGFSTAAATAASWSPAAVLEWVIPFAFGPPDLRFWGGGITGGEIPLLLTLYPGVLAAVLLVAAGRPSRPAARWAMAAIGLGLFLALGRYNPVVGWILRGPAASAFRLPAKFWLMAAVGFSTLCAIGFERLIEGPGRRAAKWALAGIAVFYGVAWFGLTFLSGSSHRFLRGLVPARFPDDFVDAERLRWAGVCLVTLVLLAGFALLLRRIGRNPVAAAGLLLLVHLGGQIFFLRLALPTDRTGFYLEPPALLSRVAADDLVVWGSTDMLFGAAPVPVTAYPDHGLRWLQRQVSRELQPAAGIFWGRRYELSLSAEGLDSFLSRATAQSFGQLDDLERIRLLAASGVDVLLLARPLEAVPAGDAALEHRSVSETGTVYVYRLPRSTPEVYFATRVLRAPHLNAALGWLASADFEPAESVVLPGGGPPVVSPPGAIEVLDLGAERLRVSVEGEGPGALVVQRAWLPIWRASVDGEAAPVVVANMHRMAVELEAGSHVVELRVERSSLRWSLVASALALVGLVLVAIRGSRRPDAGH